MKPPVIGEKVQWMNKHTICVNDLEVIEIEDGRVHAVGWEDGAGISCVMPFAAWEKYREMHREYLELAARVHAVKAVQ